MRRNIVIQIIVFLTAVTVSTVMIVRSEQNRLKMERARVSDMAGDYAHALQVNIERSLSATYALAALVRQGKGNVPDFDATATEMLPFYPGAASLQLAPGGIVKQIVPLAGNKGAIGHDLLKDPTRTKEAFLARDTGKLTLAGPFDLVQGGIGAVGRLPVFLDNGRGNPYFWGFTIVLIRFPEVLEAAQLSNLEKRGFNYKLWRIHPDSKKAQIISASSEDPPVSPVDRPLELPNGRWILSVAPMHGWGDPMGIILKSAFGAIFSLLVYVLTHSMLNTRTKARQMAEQLTNDLNAREQEFRALAENSPDTIIRYDPCCRRVYVNPAFEQKTGIPMAEALGLPTEESWQGSMPLAEYQQCLRQVIETGAPSEIFLDWTEKDGHTTHHSLRIVPEHDQLGTITGVLVIGRDITALNQSQEALKKLNEELEERVKDRTAELEAKNGELERLNKIFVGRELKMVELKERIRELEEQTPGIREKPKYE